MLFDGIPPTYQLAAVVLVGLCGFLFVIKISSVKSGVKATETESTLKSPEKALEKIPTTPGRGTPKRRSAGADEMGSVATPYGRRSARLVAKSATKKSNDDS